tara:strand:+ start:3967 stop:4494 length:528 start_codon:yes stop_codon:yes gene_type:complete
MDEFLSIFREHEEELEVACPDFAVRVQELMQADIVASNRVGSRYSKQFSEDISMRCGGVATDAKVAPAPAAPAKDEAGGGGPSTKSSKKRKVEELSLEQRVKLQLEEKMAEDREMSQLVASMEEKILDMGVEEPGHSHVEEAQFVEMCDDCGERHIQQERECHMCMEVHEGCCNL